DFCSRHDLIICSDEIHCDLILEPGRPHVSILNFEEFQDRTILFMAASKTYNLAGLGCAYAVIPNPELRQRFQAASGGLLPPVNLFGYAATEAAYRYGETWRQQLLVYLRENRDHLMDFIKNRIPSLQVSPIEATYLAWIDVRELGQERPIPYFHRHGLGLSNGKDFGAPGHVRFNFGCSRALLNEGLERMKTAADSAQS
ncbi:MAG: aminotransferase class I/II-fold pyridoxal phosphate-dependent enzyme, partial [Verrucomicrobiota bacterium]